MILQCYDSLITGHRHCPYNFSKGVHDAIYSRPAKSLTLRRPLPASLGPPSPHRSPVPSSTGGSIITHDVTHMLSQLHCPDFLVRLNESKQLHRPRRGTALRCRLGLVLLGFHLLIMNTPKEPKKRQHEFN